MNEVPLQFQTDLDWEPYYPNYSSAVINLAAYTLFSILLILLLIHSIYTLLIKENEAKARRKRQMNPLGLSEKMITILSLLVVSFILCYALGQAIIRWVQMVFKVPVHCNYFLVLFVFIVLSRNSLYATFIFRFVLPLSPLHPPLPCTLCPSFGRITILPGKV